MEGAQPRDPMDEEEGTPAKKRPRVEHLPPMHPHRKFDGRTFYLNRLEGELTTGRPQDLRLTFQQLLHPIEQLDMLLLTAMAVDKTWLLKSLSDLPTSTRKCLIHDHLGLPEAHRKELVEAHGWEVHDPGSVTQHAKLIVCRFATGFVRVAITSSNLTAQWEWAREQIWYAPVKRDWHAAWSHANSPLPSA